MGTFATTTSLQILMPGTSFDSATTTLCSQCITWAENAVRTRLARRFDVSATIFTTAAQVPGQVTSITEALAIGHYFKLASRGSKESIARGEALISQAMKELEMLASGEVDLLNTSFAAVSVRSNEVLSSTIDYHETFDEDDPLNWGPDSDKLTDIADGRV